jgi:hypothetical protein
VALGLWLWLIVLSPGESMARPERLERAGDEFFRFTNIVRLAIDLDPTALATLRERSGAGDRPRALCTVTEGGRLYTNVSIQLKGFSSFRPIDDRPSVTLKFNRHVPGQRFHHLEKISLNNSIQDPTRLNEPIARELFAAAGVPVPRAIHAVLALNGRDLGLYVLTEGFDKTFLGGHFARVDGTLYEGGTLQDIDAESRPTSGPEAAGAAALHQLIAAARDPDGERRFQRLQRWLDVERFISMMAMETLLCHSDSYSMNRNNYRFYHDPGTDRFVFMPHGMDRILGGHRSDLDLTIVPPQLGLVARGLLTTETGRAQYLKRLVELRATVFDPERLCHRVEELDSAILDEKSGRASRPRARRGLARDHRLDSAELCRALTQRAADVSIQLDALAEYMGHPRLPRFDAAGASPLDDWVVRPVELRPAVALQVERKPNRTLLHLSCTNGPLRALLVQRLTLPGGNYQLTGGIEVVEDASEYASPPVDLMTTMQRWAATRFQSVRTSLDSWAMDTSLRVATTYAPEELELICEVRSSATRVTLDVTRLRLVRPSRPNTE